MKNKLIKVCSACLVLMLLQGCATSHDKALVENLAPDGYSVDKLVVVGMIDDDATRTKCENAFANKMKELGVDCDTSYQGVPNINDLDDEAKYIKAKSTTTANTSVVIEITEVNREAIQASNALFGVWVAGVLLGDDTLRGAGAWGGLAASSEAGNLEMRVTLWSMDDDSLLWSMDTNSYNYALAYTNKSGELMAELVHRELKEGGLIN
jgi:hypothetical protein